MIQVRQLVVEEVDALHKLSLSSGKWLRELIHASVKTSCEPRFLHRLHCLLLIAEGRSCYEVARWFGEDPRTIERWVHALDWYGIEGLREHHAGGRPPSWLTSNCSTLLSTCRSRRTCADIQSGDGAESF